MQNIFYTGKVLWSQVDANMHLRHSAYADFGAEGRLGLLEAIGFTSSVLRKLNIGPILFREELIYKREVNPGDTIKVSCELRKTRKDGSRWSFTQVIYRSDGVEAAIINTDGAWLDKSTRKLTALPEEWSSKLMEIPKAEDFVLEDRV
ncbi:MAG TPA: thioesterase family protein [Bacteroidia bacterium]